RALADVGSFEHDCRLLMRDGSIKYLHLVAHLTEDREGWPEYLIAVQDVTDRQETEQTTAKLRSELARMARVSSLSALTASIVHEINQPLSGIVANAGACLRKLAADAPNIAGARETVQRTVRDANRVSDVITRLRALACKKAPTVE